MIETQPTKAEQLLNARIFDLEVIILAQAQRIDELESEQKANFDRLRASLENAVKSVRRELRDDLIQDVRRGLR